MSRVVDRHGPIGSSASGTQDASIFQPSLPRGPRPACGYRSRRRQVAVDRARRAALPATLARFSSSSSPRSAHVVSFIVDHGTQHPGDMRGERHGLSLRDRRLIRRRGRRGDRRRRLGDRVRGGIRRWRGLWYRLWHRWLGDFRSVIHVQLLSRMGLPPYPPEPIVRRRRHDDPSAGVRRRSLRTSSAVRAPSIARIGCRSRAGCCSHRGRTFDLPDTSGRVGVPSRAGRPDREPLIVSLCHRRAPPSLDRTGRRRATRRRVDPNGAPTVQVGGSSSGTRRSGMSNHTRVDPSASTPQRSLRAPRCRGGRRHAIRPHRMGLVRAPPLPTGRGAISRTHEQRSPGV